MAGSAIERQRLFEAISDLPDEALVELASFLEYLRYKASAQQREENAGADFLAAVAGLGASGEEDVSERDEEILSREVGPIRGWHLS